MEVLIAPVLLAVSCIIFDVYLSKKAVDLFGKQKGDLTMNKERIEDIKERLSELHTYLMNNTGTVFVCKKCGRQDFYESIGSMGSDSGMICDCGNEEMHEYILSDYHQDISGLLEALEEAEKKWVVSHCLNCDKLTAQLQAEQEKVKGLESQNRLLHKRIDARG